MLPPPQRCCLWSDPRPAMCLIALALLGLAGGCGGGDGGTEPILHPTKLSLVTPPSPQGQSRVNLVAQPVVQLQDDQDTAVPQAGVPVTASIATGGGSLSGTTTVNTSSTGRATFTQLAISGLAGPRTLTFSSPDLLPVTSGTIDLSPGAAASIALNDGGGQTTGTGGVVPVAPSVVVTDADNNHVAGVPVTFQVTAGGGTVDPTTPISTNTNGIATVTSWTLGASPGPNSLSASASGLAGSPVVIEATGVAGSTISGTITVNNSLMARTKTLTAGASSSIPLLPRTKFSRPLRGILQEPPTRSFLGRRQTDRAPEYTPNELIVTIRARSIGAPPLGSVALAMRSSAAAVGDAIRARLLPHLAAEHLRVTGVSPAILTARIRVPEGTDLKRVAAALLKDPAVSSVDRNRIVRLDRALSPFGAGFPVRSPNDPFYSFQAWHYGMIDAPEAWSISTGSTSVLVAVVDDGIRFDHPAIAANLTTDGYDFVSDDISIPFCAGGSSTLSGDGDGYDPDPTIPAEYEFDPDLECLGGLLTSGNHGLHVAGTIGAVGDDGLGVTGINWSVRIRPVRVVGVHGGGTLYDIAQGLLYAAGLPADNGAGGTVQATTGARIINMSLGGPGDDPALASAVTAASNAGALIIASAGNTGTSDPRFPAAYPEVVSVSAVGPDRQLASYSSFGSTIDIAAPGGDFADGDGSFGILSTVWNFVTGSPTYDVFNGTSMAAPHVAGVAALILAANPGLSASQLRSRLLDFAVDVGVPGPDDRYGAGIVNARNSLTQNFAPPRQLRAVLYDALTGSVRQTVPASGGAYSFTGVSNGVYHVFAGEDESGDQLIGLPGRRWGAYGGAATATSINVRTTGTYAASFSIGFPSEVEPNGTLANADILPVGGYVRGTMDPVDVDVYRVLIPQAGQYTFETSPVDGACGFALEEDTLLRLYDADGALIASNDDIDTDAFNFCARVTKTLAAGTYHVHVRGLFGGVYRVQVRSGS
jgi:subtilisin family serine protease